VPEVVLVLALDHFEMRGQVRLRHAGEHGHMVLVALAAPHDELVPGGVDVLHAGAGALE
jgi:hypothetical protein